MKDKSTKFTYRNRQSNHETCFIPECVRCYSTDPLYIIVAHWCVIQGGWVDRNSISRAFFITGRRASFLITYIHSKPDCVACNIRKIPVSGRVFRYEICVGNVSHPVRKALSGVKRVNRQTIVNSSKSLSEPGKILFNEIMHQLRTRSLSQKGESDENDS
ncbi:CaiF/GrlA family transcriptional regulator [Salmonella enterica]|nr:CaiF/GrlA family transcriptional regulator [Salmonella enterica]ECH1722133.1 CaiF/GrlA family transcriptional regulator [Salmonella enterica]EIN5301821.1 CaiF/GrlA family transcriptional regulator [Salmonella enterica]EIV8923695.1 CaiF/GrlA family transcriptional regulator [Salmonella enterica]